MSAAERAIAPIGFLVVAGPNQAFAITPAQLQAALLQSQLAEQRHSASQHHTNAVPATTHRSQIEPRNSWNLVNAKNSSTSLSGKRSNVTLLEFQPPGPSSSQPSRNPFLRAGAIESGRQQQQQLVMSRARESRSNSSSSLREDQGQLLTMQEAFLQARVHAG